MIEKITNSSPLYYDGSDAHHPSPSRDKKIMKEQVPVVLAGINDPGDVTRTRPKLPKPLQSILG